MSIPKLYHDPRGDQSCEITTFFHCRQCLEELPPNESPRSYQRIQVGLHPDGAIQVWCTRHECNVNIMSFRPRPGLNYEGQEPIRPDEMCDCCAKGAN